VLVGSFREAKFSAEEATQLASEISYEEQERHITEPGSRSIPRQHAVTTKQTFAVVSEEDAGELRH